LTAIRDRYWLLFTVPLKVFNKNDRQESIWACWKIKWH
jgi:hypothetical protein